MSPVLGYLYNTKMPFVITFIPWRILRVKPIFGGRCYTEFGFTCYLAVSISSAKPTQKLPPLLVLGTAPC